ncbi:hypothetical protein COT98_03180 [Candidatus Falkowbacteria bacterium CG10_big_fil_rev_8_21_14_0_10_39_9]|uniref:DoxX family protein n=1 Tax=Candidatus Falkowbacteria bacterium CG10_big_fil_rev_8_21_14_0_10_39_9 TaxID=1974566 RepID=A0A2M6WNW9_9BACT|nr:MAG: hypothetical protein COT98_03180 [Candidatus Falkowbacteria bacterium CG10_big_fil_rev_8_21_14_0_10_39_9]
MKLNIIKNPSILLRILMGLVFFAAGVFRLFVPQAALNEMASLNMAGVWIFPIAAFEIVVGLSLFFNRYVKYSSAALIIFLFGALVKGLILGGKDLWLAAGELFVFDINPTDWFMHLAFWVILLVLFLSTIAKNSPNVPTNTQQD